MARGRSCQAAAQLVSRSAVKTSDGCRRRVKRSRHYWPASGSAASPANTEWESSGSGR